MSTVAESRAVGPLPDRWKQGIIGELWAEFFGCFILICFGDGVVAMLWALIGSGRTAAGNTAVPFNSSGDWLLITWGWALAVCFAIYTVGGVTGAHINPAVTLGAAIRRNLPWRKVVPYWVVQVLGCFVGAALVYLVYVNAIDRTTPPITSCGVAMRPRPPTARSRRSRRRTSAPSGDHWSTRS